MHQLESLCSGTDRCLFAFQFDLFAFMFRSPPPKQFPSIHFAHYSKATEPNINPAPVDLREPRRGARYYAWPSYQPYVIGGSFAVFLIYFIILREENDVDQKMGIDYSLQSRQLKAAYEHQKRNGLPTDETVRRLEAMGISLKTLEKSYKWDFWCFDDRVMISILDVVNDWLK